MKKLNLILSAGAAAGLSLLAAVAVAASAIIEEAKDACIIGEGNDGYLGYVDPTAASTELKREVRDVNQQRKAVYADLAQRNGVSIEATAKLTAEKLINNADRGECVQNADGTWVKR